MSEPNWDDFPADGAVEHDHYIYGTPKKSTHITHASISELVAELARRGQAIDESDPAAVKALLAEARRHVQRLHSALAPFNTFIEHYDAKRPGPPAPQVDGDPIYSIQFIPDAPMVELTLGHLRDAHDAYYRAAPPTSEIEPPIEHVSALLRQFKKLQDRSMDEIDWLALKLSCSPEEAKQLRNACLLHAWREGKASVTPTSEGEDADM